MPAVSSIIAGAALGLTAFSVQQQKKATKDASEAQRKAEMEARRIAAEKKPMEETATLLSPTDEPVSALTSLNLLVDPTTPRPKKTTGLGTSMSSTGLGFGG